jgi:Ca2+/H+ antiporter
MVDESRVISLLEQIKDQGSGTRPFNYRNHIITMIMGAIGFVMGLSLNTAVRQSIDEVNVKHHKILSAWIYCLVVITAGITVTAGLQYWVRG